MVLMQAPHVVGETKEKGKQCVWAQDGEELMMSEGYRKVQMMITKQIMAMDGRSDKLFVGGVGAGGALALQAAFYSPDAIGGAFCADSEVPPNILTDV